MPFQKGRSGNTVTQFKRGRSGNPGVHRSLTSADSVQSHLPDLPFTLFHNSSGPASSLGHRAASSLLAVSTRVMRSNQ